MAGANDCSAVMARIKDTRLGPEKTVFHGRRNRCKKLARRHMRPRMEVWQHPEASWELHDERREKDCPIATGCASAGDCR